MPFDISTSNLLLDHIRFWGQARSLSNLERLKKYEYTLESKLSQQDQVEVKNNLEAYANPNKLRWLRAKARFRAMCYAFPSAYGVLLGLNHLKYLKLVKGSQIFGTFVLMTLFFYPFTRFQMGWSSREHYMNEYAVILKRLRNVQIRN